MELHEIPAAFQSRLRLAVVAALMTGPKDFTTLTKLTDATPGNLGKQLELLEADKFLSCQRELLGRRPRSTYQLTDTGRETFLAYVRMLEKIVGDET
ncbi:MAG: transcriptional regulator [Blautia sp.]|nr:transcriptional regulator [Blautia sp.]